MAQIDQSNLYRKLSIEQKILLSVCSIEGGAFVSPEVLLKNPFSWEKLIIHCERHRMLPLFYHNLRKIGTIENAEPLQLLKQKVGEQTQHALTLATEGLRVSELLKNNGIESIILKGPFLGQQLYSNPGLRPSKDIDILVHESHIDIVDKILFADGYKRIYPDFELSPKQKSFYQRHKNQYAYRNIRTGTLLELHWRIFSSRELLNVTTEKLFETSSAVSLAGKNAKVLSPEYNFNFLCLHGSIHQWFRLIWLRDITQLLSLNENSLDCFLNTSKAMGTERVVVQSIMLSNLFFNYPLEVNNFRQTTVIKKITKQAANAIISDESKMLTKGISRLRIPFYKMRLRKEIKYKLSCWTILHPNFTDWKTVKISDKFFILYFVLRPFIWLANVYKRKIQN